MGLGTFEAFLKKMHELEPVAAPDPSQQASACAPVIIAIDPMPEPKLVLTPTGIPFAEV